MLWSDSQAARRWVMRSASACWRDAASSTVAADDWVGRVPFTLNSDLAQLVLMTRVSLIAATADVVGRSTAMRCRQAA